MNLLSLDNPWPDNNYQIKKYYSVLQSKIYASKQGSSNKWEREQGTCEDTSMEVCEWSMWGHVEAHVRTPRRSEASSMHVTVGVEVCEELN